MVDLTELAAENITDDFKEELTQTPWFKYGRHNFPNEVKIAELVTEGNDGVAANIRVSREPGDWYDKSTDVQIDYTRALEFIELVQKVPALEPIKQMVPYGWWGSFDELTHKEMLHHRDWNVPKTVTVTPIHNQVDPQIEANGYHTVGFVQVPPALFGSTEGIGDERQIGWHIKRQFIKHVQIHFNFGSPPTVWMGMMLSGWRSSWTGSTISYRQRWLSQGSGAIKTRRTRKGTG